MASDFDYSVIIIGTGFGATVVASALAQKGASAPQGKKGKILMMERGAWWFSAERKLPGFFDAPPHSAEPVSYWTRPDHQRGIIDLLSVAETNLDYVELFRPPRPPHSLYRFNSFDEIDIITASGVGGGSLIYSNVTIEPYWDGNRYPVMENWPLKLLKADYEAPGNPNPDPFNVAKAWMETYRGKLSNVVTKFPPPADFLAKLDPQPPQAPLPEDQLFPLLGKSRWLRQAAKALGEDSNWKPNIIHPWTPLELQIIEYSNLDGSDAVKGQTYCERQGRCLLGCLPGARHTLNKTLVNTTPGRQILTGPDVELQSLAVVRYIEALKEGNSGYRVHFNDLRYDEDDPRYSQTWTAPVVVLGAGCLSSAEILLRSRDQVGLKRLSRKLGYGFSSNGDYAGFIDYRKPTADGQGTEPYYADDAPYASPSARWSIFATRGPINTSHVMFKDKKNGSVLVNFEDATVPPMFASGLRMALEVLDNAMNGRDTFLSVVQALWRFEFQDFLNPDATNPRAFQTEHEMLQNTFFFNVMGRDDARGVFKLEDDDLTLTFPDRPLASDRVFGAIEEIIDAMVKKMGGTYIRFPFWSQDNTFLENKSDPTRKIVTVHALGGCPMGHSSTDGVVDSKGRVFSTDHGSDQVYPGLYVADASVVPGPVAVNPTLTIVALALKIAKHIEFRNP